MNTSDSINACPKCGAPVPTEAPQGLCPKCVLAAAAAAEPGPTATSQVPSLERLAVAFPQLEILELVGRGGMGFVFKARQPNLDRFVALKLLPDSLAHDPQFAERFNREGRVLARFNHPNIVSIYDFGYASARPAAQARPETPNAKPQPADGGGFYFLLMEYVDGVNLRQAMQAGKFSPSEALSIVPKICEALQYAHEEGIFHRDIKPENILLDTRGRVKIADFGIAKLVGDENPGTSLTATGAAIGTPHYMAPEQIERPASVDHRADIYSLGVVFYEMLTGELPIGRFAPPSQRTPVDPRVDDVVMRTLEKERENRFQSAGEVKTSVEHLTEAGAGGRPARPPLLAGAPAGSEPRGTTVINPATTASPVPLWSKKALWAAALTVLSLPIALLAIVPLYLGAGGMVGLEILILLTVIGLPGLAGCLLGCMALSDIRAHQGRLRGLAPAVFAALSWPLLLLFGTAIVISIQIGTTVRALNAGSPLFGLLILLVPVGALTFAIWAVQAATRWGGNRPATERRGALKWMFLGLLVTGLGVVALGFMRQQALIRAAEAALAQEQAMRAEVEAAPATATPVAETVTRSRLAAAAPTVSEEAAAIRIRLAQDGLVATRQRVAAGVSGQLELAGAEQNLELAEARGDAVAAARANLKYARFVLADAQRKSEAGLVTTSELRIAESKLALAELDLKEALNRAPAAGK